MKQPIADPLRPPRHRHRRARRHELGHDVWPLIGCVALIADAVADALDIEIEAVQMHRVRLRGQIQDAPTHGLTDASGQALGVRPGEAVHEERGLRVERQKRDARIRCARDAFQLSERQARPIGDDEHAVGLGIGASGIDDERAGELGIVHRAEHHRHAGRGRPIVIGAGWPGRETDFSGFSGRDFDRSARRGAAFAQAEHSQQALEVVVNGRDHFGSLWNTHERRRDGERCLTLAERLDPEPRAGVAFGSPQSDAGAKLQS